MLKDTVDHKYSLDYSQFRKKDSFISTLNVYWYYICLCIKKVVALLCNYSSLAFGTKFYLLSSPIFWGMFRFHLKAF